MDSRIVPFEKKKKRNHDMAYLLILLVILLGTFLFVTVAINLLLRNIPIP
jgi:predicted nucleic acid-binding Zn ribbon protein